MKGARAGASLASRDLRSLGMMLQIACCLKENLTSDPEKCKRLVEEAGISEVFVEAVEGLSIQVELKNEDDVVRLIEVLRRECGDVNNCGGRRLYASLAAAALASSSLVSAVEKDKLGIGELKSLIMLLPRGQAWAEKVVNNVSDAVLIMFEKAIKFLDSSERCLNMLKDIKSIVDRIGVERFKNIVLQYIVQRGNAASRDQWVEGLTLLVFIYPEKGCRALADAAGNIIKALSSKGCSGAGAERAARLLTAAASCISHSKKYKGEGSQANLARLFLVLYGCVNSFEAVSRQVELAVCAASARSAGSVDPYTVDPYTIVRHRRGF